MKWIYPSVCMIVAAYMYHLDKGDSGTIFTLGFIWSVLCIVIEFSQESKDL